MALLSNVTHQKVDLRKPTNVEDDVEIPFATGIHRVGHFEGPIRCAALATANSARVPGEVVWTGEQDGSLAVRQGDTGMLQCKLPRKKEVYPTCLLAHGVYMWCGLSDGCLRIYDQQSIEFCYELKQHAGSIRCMHAVGNMIFTGSNDWQIIQWDAQHFVYVGQFSGHTNSVTCMTSEGPNLFSGSDDCTLRCWDLDLSQHCEREGRWPILAHSNSVRAVECSEVFLFSASADGTLKAWNTQTGDLVRFMDRREGSLTTLVRDPVTGRLWCGGVDGVICVWDCASFALTARLQGHVGTYCNLLTAVCRASAMKAWAVDSTGFSRVWFAEWGHVDKGFANLIHQEEDLQGTVDKLRTTVIGNYEELEQRKEQLRRIETVDDFRKRALSRIFGWQAHLALRRAYYLRLLAWDGQTTRAMRRRELADLMGRGGVRGLGAVYLARLKRYRRLRREQRKKEAIAVALTHRRQGRLQTAYFASLLRYKRDKALERARTVATGYCARHSARLTLSLYYAQLERWRRARRAIRQRGEVVEGLLRNSQRGLAAIYWYRLAGGFRDERHREWKEQLRRSMLLRCDGRMGIMCKAYLRLLERLRRRQYKAPRAEMKALQLRMQTARGIALCCWRKLLRKARHRREAHLAARLRNRVESNEMRMQTLSMDSMTDEEIDQELERQTEAARAAAEARQSRLAELESMRRERAQLRSALVLSQPDIDQSKSLPEQFEEVLLMLKGKAFHFGADYDQMADLRERVKGSKDAAQRVYAAGLAKVKAAVLKHNQKEHQMGRAETFPPGSEVWMVRLSADETFLSRAREKDAAGGVREMIYAADCMSSSQRERLAHCSETVANAGVLLDVVLGDAKRRRRRGRSAGPRGPGSRDHSNSSSPSRPRRSSRSPGRAARSDAASSLSLGYSPSRSRGSASSSRHPPAAAKWRPPQAGGAAQRRASSQSPTKGAGASPAAPGRRTARASPRPVQRGASGEGGTRPSSRPKARPVHAAEQEERRASATRSPSGRQPQRRAGASPSPAAAARGVAPLPLPAGGTPPTAAGPASARRVPSAGSAPRQPASARRASGSQPSQSPADARGAPLSARRASGSQPSQSPADARGSRRTSTSQPLQSPADARGASGGSGRRGGSRPSQSPADARGAGRVSQSPADTRGVSPRPASRPLARQASSGSAQRKPSPRPTAVGRTDSSASAAGAAAGGSGKGRPAPRSKPATADQPAVERPFLGIEMLPSGGGTVHGVRPDGPAAKIGVGAGDTLLTINGHPVSTTADLQALEGSLAGHVGEHLDIVVRSGETGEQRTFACSVHDALEYSRLEAYDRAHRLPNPRPPPAAGAGGAARRSKASGSGGPPWLGLTVSAAVGSTCDVVEVAPDGPAAKAGIQTGDVITSINGDRVVSRSDFGTMFRRHARIGARIRVGTIRQGQSHLTNVMVQTQPVAAGGAAASAEAAQ